MKEVDWESWPPRAFPCTLVEEWKCPTCRTVHLSEFHSGELGDDDKDSFDFHCQCGDYFKKFWRVPQDCQLRSGWRK
jgi:hypothetical protein